MRLRQHDADVLAGRTNGDPAEALGRDIVADLEAESIPVEAEGLVGVVDGNEHRGNGDCHAMTVRGYDRGCFSDPARSRSGFVLAFPVQLRTAMRCGRVTTLLT